MGVIEFFKANDRDFPLLCPYIRALLCVPVSASACDSGFAASSMTVTKHRNLTSVSIVEALAIVSDMTYQPDYSFEVVKLGIAGLARAEAIEEFERDGVPKRNVLFKRNDRKWREFFPQLKEPSTSALRLAATACAAVLQECEFSIWYLARQSEAVQNHVAKKTACGQAARQSTYKEMLCRVCHQ